MACVERRHALRRGRMADGHQASVMDLFADDAHAFHESFPRRKNVPRLFQKWKVGSRSDALASASAVVRTSHPF